MKLEEFPIGAIDWRQIQPVVLPGSSGAATARTCRLGTVQLRLVDYSAGYVADHWCFKGHIVFVVAGNLVIEQQDGCRYSLTPGMCFHVADNDSPPHRALSEGGARVFIVD